MIMIGAISDFSIEATIERVGDLSNTARRMGLGLCGREKSGTRIPTQTKNKGIMKVMKRTHRLCFSKRFILLSYQNPLIYTRWLKLGIELSVFMLQCQLTILYCSIQDGMPVDDLLKQRLEQLKALEQDLSYKIANFAHSPQTLVESIVP